MSDKAILTKNKKSKNNKHTDKAVGLRNINWNTNLWNANEKEMHHQLKFS